MTPDPYLEIARGIEWIERDSVCTVTCHPTEAAQHAIAAAIQTAVEARDAEWRKQTEEHLNAGRVLMDGIRALYPSYIGQGQTTEIAWINQQTLGELQARSVAYEEYRVRAENAEAEVARLTAEREKERADGMVAHRWFARQFGEIMNGRDFAVKCPMATEALAASRDALTERIKEKAEDALVNGGGSASMYAADTEVISIRSACAKIRALVDAAKEG